MASARDIPVTTTSQLEGIPIKQYYRPVSAHVVAGMNLFSDFMGGITDFFGGRSKTYQRQMMSLHNEAIERIKRAAQELGANGIVGLNIDIDEISGKGKSMLMITATGTAVLLDKPMSDRSIDIQQNTSSISIEQLHVLRKKEQLLKQVAQKTWPINEETWNFIIEHAFDEFYPYLIERYPDALKLEQVNFANASFSTFFFSFIDGLTDTRKRELLYGSLTKETSPPVLNKLFDFLHQLHLFEFTKVTNLLNNPSFDVQKRGLRVATFDQPIYSTDDLKNLEVLKNVIQEKFPERGIKTKKTGMLSSKEKEVWKCECGKTNDLDHYCSGCKKDIYGCLESEISLSRVVEILNAKMLMIAGQLSIN